MFSLVDALRGSSFLEGGTIKPYRNPVSRKAEESADGDLQAEEKKTSTKETSRWTKKTTGAFDASTFTVAALHLAVNVCDPTRILVTMPLKYKDVWMQTVTDVDNVAEHKKLTTTGRSMVQSLFDEWTGRSRCQFLRPRPQAGHKWTNDRLTAHNKT